MHSSHLPTIDSVFGDEGLGKVCVSIGAGNIDNTGIRILLGCSYGNKLITTFIT